MAKEGAITHPKTKLLAAVLRIERSHAIGLLECLWAFTRHYAPEGDIGRWPDLMIWEDMHTKIPAARLMQALIDCGFLDEDPEHRLVVHGWKEHCTIATAMAVKARGKGFVKGDDPRRNKNTDAANARRDAANHAAKPNEHAANQNGDAAKNDGDAATRAFLTIPNHIPPTPLRGGRRFVKPCLAEVTAYMESRRIPDALRLAQKFIDHYDSNGWKVGRNGMKDWQAAVRTWEQRRSEESVSTNGKPLPVPRRLTPEEMEEMATR